MASPSTPDPPDAPVKLEESPESSEPPETAEVLDSPMSPEPELNGSTEWPGIRESPGSPRQESKRLPDMPVILDSPESPDPEETDGIDAYEALEARRRRVRATRRASAHPAGPKSKRRAWAEEAMRTIMRYNLFRGLTVAECVEEMEPFFNRKKIKEPKLVVIHLYRELNQDLFHFQGEISKPVAVCTKEYLPEKLGDLWQDPGSVRTTVEIEGTN